MKSIFIHQPEYFPWTHYFEKIYLSEIIVILDSVQYARRSYQNRNLIFSNNGPKWITLPIIKSSRNTKIIDIKINNEINWQQKHFDLISLTYKKNIFFNEVNHLFNNVFNKKWDYLYELNIYILKQIIKYLNLNKKIYLLSELKLNSRKSNLILDICKYFSADEYITGIGSQNYLNQNDFTKNDIKINYLKPKNNKYNQNNSTNFIPNLSILDYLYNNGCSTNLLK